ncbi:MAG: hypothetical protein NDI77_17515 [Geobacteraceae bacterium]|nr:hypothetical protein [Geobacteraceae bacterium]
MVDFEDPNKKCRRWIRPDELGAIVVRQDGKGKEGSYSLRMTQLRAGAERQATSSSPSPPPPPIEGGGKGLCGKV